MTMAPEVLKRLVGKWSGTCRTWFEPEKLADESIVAGEFIDVLEGRFIRHVYTGSMQGKPRHGEDLLAYNGVRQVFQSAWVDDFHMNYALLISEGPATDKGFQVVGYYDVAGYPPIAWRTEFEFSGANELTICAYNIMPDSPAALAVETKYTRQ